MSRCHECTYDENQHGQHQSKHKVTKKCGNGMKLASEYQGQVGIMLILAAAMKDKDFFPVSSWKVITKVSSWPHASAYAVLDMFHRRGCEIMEANRKLQREMR